MAANFIPYDYLQFNSEEQLKRASEFFELCNRKRTVRQLSSKPVSRELLEILIRTAGTAPSGANKQPWRFIIVTDNELKRRIRIAAEKEERLNYEHRMSQEWLDDLAMLGTDWHKEFLEVAPALIVVFSVEYEKEGDGDTEELLSSGVSGISRRFPSSRHSQRWTGLADAYTEPNAFPARDPQPPAQRTCLRPHSRRLSARERDRAEHKAKETGADLHLAVNQLRVNVMAASTFSSSD